MLLSSLYLPSPLPLLSYSLLLFYFFKCCIQAVFSTTITQSHPPVIYLTHLRTVSRHTRNRTQETLNPMVSGLEQKFCLHNKNWKRLKGLCDVLKISMHCILLIYSLHFTFLALFSCRDYIFPNLIHSLKRIL